MTDHCRRGSETAEEIFSSVGMALSWWEASEDILMGVFKWVCGAHEPLAFETYVGASRSGRTRMLLAVMKLQRGRLAVDEVAAVKASMNALDKLAPVRNQIAHGHVTHTSFTENGTLVMQGNFLVPSLNERGVHIERGHRYALTAAEIDTWRDQVRVERGKIMDALFAAQDRDQKIRQARSSHAVGTIALAEAILDGRFSPEDFQIIARQPVESGPSGER